MLTQIVGIRLGRRSTLNFITSVVRDRTEDLGSDHPDTIDARVLRAWHTHRCGDPELAPVRAESLRPLAAVTEVPEQGLAIRFAAAFIRAELGDWQTAAREADQLATEWAQLPDAPDWGLPNCRLLSVSCTRKAHGPGAAVHELRLRLGEPFVQTKAELSE
ncbi:hypothetical protein O3S80_42425 [Streptomyces sp. Lzd4kr]|nr:hypothetical protein [Streptomyces sp. Lzd4kr]